MITHITRMEHSFDTQFLLTLSVELKFLLIMNLYHYRWLDRYLDDGDVVQTCTFRTASA